jgi:membrane carboxypeptidase/penicillin-binding protein PbpC
LDRFGDPDSYDLSLALGGGEVRLLDLTAAYGVFANRGERVEPFAVLEVRNTQTDTVLYAHEAPRPQPVLDQRLAWLISDILSDNAARTLGFGPNSVLRLDRQAAVKTGTTTNFHDNWTIGYTPGLVVGVWAGNPDYSPMRDVSGVSGAAPIWADFMRSALRGQAESWYEVPDGLVQVEVCASAGLLPGPDCPYRFREWFIQGTQPRTTERLFHRLKIDLETGQIASGQTPPERIQERLVLDLPLLAQAWARLQGITLLSDVKQAAGAGRSDLSEADGELTASRSDLVLLSPADQSIYRIDPGFPIDSQRIKIEAASSGVGAVTLWVDDQPLAVLDAPPYAAWWQLEPGEHSFWATQEANSLRSPTVIISITE